VGRPAGGADTWRDELDAFLAVHLPEGWRDAVASGDDAAILARRKELDTAAFVAELGRAGWVAPGWDPAYGGRGADHDTALAVRSYLDELEVPRVPRGSGLPLAAPTILEWSSEETKCRLLPPIATGEERWCQLFSEPGAGSDLASLATTAVLDGDEWVVNGQKVWTTLGHESEFAMLLARTDPDVAKHQGITYFGLDLRSPGVEVRPLRNMAGRIEFNEVFLDDVRVPDLHRISPVGDGWKATRTTLGAERHALSGGARKKRKATDEILGGRTMDDVLDLARQLGVTGDPLWRQRLAGDHGDAAAVGLAQVPDPHSLAFERGAGGRDVGRRRRDFGGDGGGRVQRVGVDVDRTVGARVAPAAEQHHDVARVRVLRDDRQQAGARASRDGPAQMRGWRYAADVSARGFGERHDHARLQP